MNTIKSNIYTLVGPRDLILKEEVIDISLINADELIAETLYSAISPGTETAAYIGLEPLRSGSIYPRLMGYCNVAKVIAKGSNFEDISVGDNILTFQSHRTHFKCNKKELFFKLPNEREKLFAPAYLYHLAYHALITAKTKPGLNIGIIGGGVLGYITAIMCKFFGANTFVFSNQEEAAEKLSTDYITCMKKETAVIKKIADTTHHTGIDVLINTSNSWQDWRFALEVTNKGGVIVNLGFPGRGEPSPLFNPLDPQFVYTKHLTIKALCPMSESDIPFYEIRFSLRRNMEYIIQLINSGKIDPNKIITEEINYTLLSNQYDRYISRNSFMLSTLLNWKK